MITWSRHSYRFTSFRLVEGNVQLPRQPSLRIGRCPPPSRMFTGRQDILDQMDTYFSKSASLERRLFVLHGLGGAGKTQLALRFIQKHKDLYVYSSIYCSFFSLTELPVWLCRFSDIFFIDATTRETVSTGLAAIAKAAGAGTTPQEAMVWLVSKKDRWLLVLNNADNPELNMREFFPVCAHGDILITTRNQQMINHATGPESYCRVGGMRPDDALQLLLNTSGFIVNEETAITANTLVEVRWSFQARFVSLLIMAPRSSATLRLQSLSLVHICVPLNVVSLNTTASSGPLEHVYCEYVRASRKATISYRYSPLGRPATSFSPRDPFS